MNVFELFTTMGESPNYFNTFVKGVIDVTNKLNSAINSIDFGKIEYSINLLILNSNLHDIDFPPCHYLKLTEIKKLNELFSDKIDFESNKINVVTTIIDLYDELIKDILNKWETSNNLDTECLPILSEAIANYFDKKYYSCVALLISLFGDVISKNGKKIDELTDEEIVDRKKLREAQLKELIETRNQEKYKTKEKIDEENSKINLKSERNWLSIQLDIFRNIETIFFQHYFDSFVFASNGKGNHPNRPKIAHGVKKDYGTKETALKAILCMDMLIRYPLLFETKMYHDA